MKLNPVNPGSYEARMKGCTCPVMDNARGRGFLGNVKDENRNTVFVMQENCPLHGKATDVAKE